MADPAAGMYHDDAIKWTYFSASLAICARNSSVTGEFLTYKASVEELWCFLRSAEYLATLFQNLFRARLTRHADHIRYL